MHALHLSEWTQIIINHKKKFMLGFIVLILSLLFVTLRHYSGYDFFEKDYKIGQDTRWIGMGLQGKERNFSAFNGDFLSLVAKIEHIHFHLISGQIEELTKELELGRLDGVLTTLKPSPFTSDNFIFSRPYYLTGPVLITSKESHLSGWNENSKKIIGIQARSNVLAELEKDHTVQLKPYVDILEALSDLSKRRIDAVVFPSIPAHVYTETFYGKELKIASLPLNEDGVRLMAQKNKNGQELIQLFNQGLTQMKQKGSYQELLNRWGLVNVDKFEAD